MSADINGKPVPGSAAVMPEPPHWTVARTVYERCLAEGDTPWADLPEAQRADVVEYVELILGAHVEFLIDHNYKIVPPGAAPVPKTEADAMAMLQAAKAFFDGQKRKGKLMGAGPTPALILPGRKH